MQVAVGEMAGRPPLDVILGNWNAWIPPDEELYGGEEDQGEMSCIGIFGFCGVNVYQQHILN